MPIYEYVCPTCGTFEEMRKVSDPVLTVCPKGHAGVERKISAGGFILKGSGWYATDYARKAGAAKPGGQAEPSASADPKAGGDAKPAGSAKAPADPKPASETKPAATGSKA